MAEQATFPLREIQLFTRDGRLVGKCKIVSMQPPYEGILWGERTFFRMPPDGRGDSDDCYMEGVFGVPATPVTP